jgi:hypothetical protein
MQRCCQSASVATCRTGPALFLNRSLAALATIASPAVCSWVQQVKNLIKFKRLPESAADWLLPSELPPGFLDSFKSRQPPLDFNQASTAVAPLPLPA